MFFKFITNTILAPIIFLFSGCFLLGFEKITMFPIGVQVHNYPEWVGDKYNPLSSASEWMDWQSESGSLNQYLPDSFNKKNYNGEFRLIDIGQNISIEFDDGVSGCFLYLFIKDSKDKNDEISYTISQDNDIKFVINGYALDKLYNENDLNQLIKNEPERVAQLEYNYITETDDYYRYKYALTINNVLIFESEIKAFKDTYYIQNTYPKWLPLNFYETEWKLENNLPDVYLRVVSLNKTPMITPPDVIINFTSKSYYPLYGIEVPINNSSFFFHGGIKQVGDIDDTNKTVKYSLQGGSPNKLKSYVILQLINEQNVKFTWLDENGNITGEQITWIEKND